MKKTAKKFDYNVYVGCSLTHAPKEFWAEVEAFKEKLRSFCNVMCFLGVNGHPANEIYEWDIQQCVYKCDLMVAICNLPSIGLGYEMATQVEARRMPCLAIAQENAKVTDLIWDTRQPGYEFRRYKILEKDAVEMVIEKLKKIQKSHKLSKQKTLS